MKKILTIAFGLIVISAFAGTVYYLHSKSEEAPVVFETAQPVVATIVKKTVATGSVVPRKEVEIKPQISGIVAELFVEPGDRVRRDDTIARIAIIPNMLSLNDAENRVNQARIALDNARLDLERNRRLRDEGILAQAEFQRVELAHENAREELSAAINHLDLIRKGTREAAEAASNTLVRATIDGIVLEVPLEEGDSVIEANTFNAGTTIATVADMSELVFDGKVDESEVGKLQPGMELVLDIGAIEGRQFRARLERIAPKGVEENGAIQFGIRAALEAQDEAFIRANYSASADIVLDRRENVLAIQEALLQFEGEEPYVEVAVAEGRFEKRSIEVGLSDGIQIEVTGGLTAEDRVKKPQGA
jgi:HlyD family secretion protein